MPPRIKKSALEIVDIAFNIVRKKGWNDLNARAIAQELKTSTSPIYVQFDSMEALETEVIKKIFTLLESYQDKEQREGPWGGGLGVVRFAMDEPNLFKAINEKRALKAMIKYRIESFEKGLASFSQLSDIQTFSPDQKRYLFYVCYLFSLGAAYSNHMRVEGELSEPYLDKVRINDLFRDFHKIITEGYIKTRTQPKLKDDKGVRKHSPML
jgi:AcrR family transcriptional regulator